MSAERLRAKLRPHPSQGLVGGHHHSRELVIVGLWSTHVPLTLPSDPFRNPDPSSGEASQVERAGDKNIVIHLGDHEGGVDVGEGGSDVGGTEARPTTE